MSAFRITIVDLKHLGLQPSIKEYKTENIINWSVDEGNNLVIAVLLENEVDEISSTKKKRYIVLKLIDGIYNHSIYDECGRLLESNKAYEYSEISEQEVAKTLDKCGLILFKISTDLSDLKHSFLPSLCSK